MDDTDPMLSIGAFAHRVGLAPSALRFYDDCGVLPPAFVDETTGYRYYHPAQQARAVLVRRLRTAGVPLTEACAVLDGTAQDARAVLERHARRARDEAAAAQAAIEQILHDLAGEQAGEPKAEESHGARARLGGAELASAVRQVAPAVAAGATRKEFPVLGGVLLEVADHDGQSHDQGRQDGLEVRLVATDRYRLAVRTLRPHSTGGAPGRVLVDGAALNELGSWALRQSEVRIELNGPAPAIHGDHDSRALPTVQGTFPDYRMILDGLPAARSRVITGRRALRKALIEESHRAGPGAEAAGGPGGATRIDLRADGHTLAVGAPESAPTRLDAIVTGPPVHIAFDPAVLVPALDAGVGPDVLLEISSDTRPVVVRSADQGGFTTLVMPVRRPETAVVHPQP